MLKHKIRLIPAEIVLINIVNYLVNMTVNIRLQIQLLIVCAIMSFSSGVLWAQNTVLNKYGLPVVYNIKGLNASIILDTNMRMIDIKKMIPNIIFDLRYASKNNFMHRKLYPSINTTYLRLPVAKALRDVQLFLNEVGLGLKIYDAYRPYSITGKMWDLIKDDRYVANPKNGSGHNRGIAVDLTIINLKTKEELPMGTGFDNFSDTAHQTFIDLSKEVLNNRKLLKEIMEKYGFKMLETEWWHYYLPNTKDFELLDIPFKKLKNNHL